MLFSPEKGNVTIHNKMEGEQGNCVQWSKLEWQILDVTMYSQTRSEGEWRKQVHKSYWTLVSKVMREGMGRKSKSCKGESWGKWFYFQEWIIGGSDILLYPFTIRASVKYFYLLVYCLCHEGRLTHFILVPYAPLKGRYPVLTLHGF